MHIGIITCEILSTEIKEIIEKAGLDKLFLVMPDANNLAVSVMNRTINERFSRALAKADSKITIKEKAIENIETEIRENGIRDSVIIKVLELRLHDCPNKLLAEIEEGIKKMSSVVDFVLLGYGLCGCTARDVERVIREAEVPVVIPRDRGEILNNCIELALGRAKFLSLREEEIGTFFMTPAGASIIKEPQVIFESTIGILAGKMNRSAAADTSRIIKLMKSHYRRVVKICYSKADENDSDYSKTVEKFAKEFGLEIKTEKGSSRIMLEALEKGLELYKKKK